MGYYLQAFIGRKESLDKLVFHFNHAVKIELKQDLSLIPMTEELFEEINAVSLSQGIGTFEYLNIKIKQEVLNVVGDDEIAYVEAEYHGGEGGQQAIIWENGKRKVVFEFGNRQINQVLKIFRVARENGMDEFDSIGLGWHRNTRDWIDERE